MDGRHIKAFGMQFHDQGSLRREDDVSTFLSPAQRNICVNVGLWHLFDG
jgi:hypothetical protein